MSLDAILREILFHVRGVRDMMQDVTFQQFTTTYAMECSVERATDIIGARVKILPLDLLARYPQVSWTQLVDHGELVRGPRIHVTSALRWWLATVVIPQLEPVILAILTETELVDHKLVHSWQASLPSSG